MLATSRSPTLAPMRAELVSTLTISPPDTVTSVVCEAGCNVTFKVRSWPIWSTMSVYSVAAIPGASTVTV